MPRLVCLIAAALLLAVPGCATAVSDSLERRGVSPREVAIERVGDAGEAAANSSLTLSDAAGALRSIAPRDGTLLARQIADANAACSEAARSAQTLRLQITSAKSAGMRWFDGWADEAGFETGERKRAALEERAGAEARFDRLMGRFDKAASANDGAVASCLAEASFLRDNPNAAAAAAHADARRAAIRAATNAVDALQSARGEASAFVMSFY